MRRIGKVTKIWIADRRKWVKDHPPDHAGYWYCYLHIHPQCLSALTQDQLTLDHETARTRDPSLRRDQSRLHPACTFCNQLKGSRSLEELAIIYPHIERLLRSREIDQKLPF